MGAKNWLDQCCMEDELYPESGLLVSCRVFFHIFSYKIKGLPRFFLYYLSKFMYIKCCRYCVGIFINLYCPVLTCILR